MSRCKVFLAPRFGIYTGLFIQGASCRKGILERNVMQLGVSKSSYFMTTCTQGRVQNTFNK